MVKFLQQKKKIPSERKFCDNFTANELFHRIKSCFFSMEETVIWKKANDVRMRERQVTCLQKLAYLNVVRFHIPTQRYEKKFI